MSGPNTLDLKLLLTKEIVWVLQDADIDLTNDWLTYKFRISKYFDLFTKN